MKDGDKFLLTWNEQKSCLVDESGRFVVMAGVTRGACIGDLKSTTDEGLVNDWSSGTMEDLTPYREKEFDGVPTKDYERLKQENATLHDDMDSMGETIRIQGIRIQEVENELRVEQSKCIPPSVDVIRENEIKYITLENLILKGLKS